MKVSFATLLSVLVLLVSDLQLHAQGLKLASAEKLQGVPLASTPFSGSGLKKKADLSSSLPTPGSQGQQNSCVAWSVAYCVKSYHEKIEENNNYFNNDGSISANAVFSPAYIYNQINQGQDGGAYIMDALNLLSSKGAVKWADMPYSDSDYKTQPNQTQHNKAGKYKIDFWRKVNVRDPKEVKAQIQAGYPVIIGAAVDDGFTRNGMNNPNYVWRSQSGQTYGHAMVVVGYDDDKGCFKLMNSWSTRWGSNGYGWVTYDLFTKVVSEGYVMKDAINGPDPNTDITNNDNNTNNNNDWNNNNNNTDDSNNTDWYDNNNNDFVDKPTDYLSTQFYVSNVEHNIFDYTKFLQGQNGMRFSGTTQIPKGVGQTYQIVVYFYADDGYGGKGQRVGSLNYNFADVTGMSAAFTILSQIPYGQSIYTNWECVIPYDALNVYRGSYDMWGNYVPYTSYLVAEPVLYVDNFAVQIGDLYQFWVQF